MLDKDPASYALLHYLWILSLAAWGGLVNYIRKVQEGKSRTFNFFELLGELVVSSFSGVIAFWGCELLEVPQLMSVIIIALAGHMGARSLFLIELFAEKWAERYVDKKAKRGTHG